MLTLANVTSDDLLYDLGSGDGRILITAAQRFGACGVGIDVDRDRIRDANDNALWAGVADRVVFHCQDLFESDFSAATVVILYLLPHLNLRLRPQLFCQLKPGTRIVSHDFDMSDWEPNCVIQVPTQEDPAMLYRWTVPAKLPAYLQLG